MYDLVRFAKYALALFRLTHMLWWENGPFDAFDWVRAKAGIRYEPAEYGQWSDSVVYLYASLHGSPRRVSNGSFWAELLNCPLCLSVWLAFPLMLAYRMRSGLLDSVADWLAMSGIATILFGWERSK